MLITSPEDRAILWREALAHRDEARESRLRFIASDILTELRGEFALYHGYEDEFVESIIALAEHDRFLDPDMLAAYQGVGVEEDAAARLFALIASRLSDLAGDERGSQDVRLRVAELHELWRERIASTEEEQHLTVAQVASRYGVTPQAVYKWIHAGKIEAEETPGGSYRVSAAQFRASRAELERRAALRRKLASRWGEEEPLTEAEVVEAVRRSRRD